MSKSLENFICVIFGVNSAMFWILFIFGIFQFDFIPFDLLFLILSLSAPLSVMITFSVLGKKINNCEKIAIGIIVIDLLQCFFNIARGFYDHTIIIGMVIGFINIIAIISFKNIHLDINQKTIVNIVKSFLFFNTIWFFILIFGGGPLSYIVLFLWLISAVILSVCLLYWKQKFPIAAK